MKLRIAALTLAVLYGALACGDSTEPETVYATYALLSVGGGDVPTIIPNSQVDVYEVLSGSMRLTSEGTFTMSVSVRITLGTTIGNQTRSDGGLITVNGRSVNFSSQSGATWTGSVSDHWLTTVVDGVTWVWER